MFTKHGVGVPWYQKSEGNNEIVVQFQFIIETQKHFCNTFEWNQELEIYPIIPSCTYKANIHVNWSVTLILPKDELWRRTSEKNSFDWNVLGLTEFCLFQKAGKHLKILSLPYTYSVKSCQNMIFFNNFFKWQFFLRN